MLYDENTPNMALKTANTDISRSNTILSEHGNQNKLLGELQNTDHLNNGNIVLENVSAKWTTENPEDTLKAIDISFPSKKLTVVIGLVGGGKVRCNGL